MATPTTNPAHGSKHPAHTGHNAPTPNTLAHLAAFSSPAPRSVPSPANHRMAISGKSPLNHSSQAPSSTTMAAANHPTGSSGAGRGGLLGSSPAGVNFDSPSAAALLGHVGGLDMGVSLSSMGMGVSMSGLGIGMGAAGTELRRVDDEERRKRLEHVIATVGKKPGRVSEEGIRRLSEKVGLDFAEEADLRARTKSLLFAAKTFMVDVVMEGDTVKKVSADMGTAETWKTASLVLQNNLTAANPVSRINLTLDKFAKNLETLARIDKLSTPEFNCFAAIEGVYNSLNNLFEHEKKAALTIIGSGTKNAEEKAAREVLCKKSGRPRMNVGDRVGLALEYWMDKRHVFCRTPPPKGVPGASEGAMEIDNPQQLLQETTNKTYSLLLEVEPCAPELYTPARLSDQWISESIERPNGANADAQHPPPDPLVHGSNIDWVDPPANFINSSEDAPPDALNLPTANSGAGKLPGVRFVAKLSPPLVLPLTSAVTLHSQVNPNVQFSLETVKSGAYEALLLRPNPEADLPPGFGIADGLKEISSERTVLVKQKQAGGGDHEAVRTHENSLFVGRNEYAVVLEEFPFSHPRQLVQLLPMLRQFAHLTNLLQSSFLPPVGKAARSQSSILSPTFANLIPLQFDLTINYLSPSPSLTAVFPPASSSVAGRSNDNSQYPSPPDSDAEMDLDSFLTLRNSTKQKALLADKPLRITVEVQSNGDLAVTEQNLYSVPRKSSAPSADKKDEAESNGEGATSADAEQSDPRVKRLGKALDVCGEFGVWVEWVGTRGGDEK